MHADEAFFLGDVLEQEVLHVGVRAVGVDRRDPLREMADIVIVLLDPFAEQAAVELAGGPRLAPRMHRRMALLDRLFQSLTEWTLCHGALLQNVYNIGTFRQNGRSCKRYCIQRT